MSSIKILSSERISPPSPSVAVTLPLSFFDAYWISLPPVQRLFLFSQPPHHYSLLLHSLKTSLSKTLALFPPLAGNLTFLPSTADVVIDSTSSAGVAFNVAESVADFSRLVGDPIHDSRSFIDLVPDLDTGSLPMPVMAVQVTRFINGGGVAVGLAVHHSVVDGNGLWRFIEAWARECRGEKRTTISIDEVSSPVHDRGVIEIEGGDQIAREFLSQAAPQLPSLSAHSLSIGHRLGIERRTFTLSPSAIKSIKQRIDGDGDQQRRRPSTFTAIASYAWRCIAHADTNRTDHHVAAAATTTNLLFLADCRSHLRPPLPASYTGNCVAPCRAISTWAALLGPGGISSGEAEISRAAKARTRDPLKGCETWAEQFKGLPEQGRVLVSGSPRFRVYEVDFGWGRPERVELVSMNKDGEVVLAGGREEGSVQVSVGLRPARMGVFAEVFMAGFETLNQYPSNSK